MQTFLVVGLALALSVSPVFAQVRFTPPPPSPAPHAPRLPPSQSTGESLADIEAGIRLLDRIKQRRAERKARKEAEKRRAQRWGSDWGASAWDDALEMEERPPRRREYPDPEDYFPSGGIEPGHIPYNCGHITGNARARADCQRNWEASDPNDSLNYGR